MKKRPLRYRFALLLMLLCVLSSTLSAPLMAGTSGVNSSELPRPASGASALPPSAFTIVPSQATGLMRAASPLLNSVSEALTSAVAAATVVTGQPQLLMVPWGVPVADRAANDWIWYYSNGGWNK